LLSPGDEVVFRSICEQEFRENCFSGWSVVSEPVFRVLKPGLLSTLQDLGRHGYQRLGVSPGGAMDAFALRWPIDWWEIRIIA
jgi:hypothetical protein